MSLMALAAILAFSLAGCAAGVTAGSATFESGPDSRRICTHTYGGHWQVPDNPDNGLREERQCVIAPSDDD
jgi:outer membrane lipoprotein SlyB